MPQVERPIDGHVVGHQCRRGDARRERREVVPAEVAMHDVELAGPRKRPGDVRLRPALIMFGDRLPVSPIGALVRMHHEPDGLRRVQGRAGLRLPGGEQRHLVSAAHQLLGEPGEHELDAAVAGRGDWPVDGADLGNTHGYSIRDEGMPSSR
jgi:hypothetical protein